MAAVHEFANTTASVTKAASSRQRRDLSNRKEMGCPGIDATGPGHWDRWYISKQLIGVPPIGQAEKPPPNCRRHPKAWLPGAHC